MEVSAYNLRVWRQGDHEFKTSPGYRASSRPVWKTQEGPVNYKRKEGLPSWHRLLTLPLRGKEKEDLKFMVYLGYKDCSKPDWATKVDPVSKQELFAEGQEKKEEQANIWNLESFPGSVPAQTGWGLRLHLLNFLELESLFITAVVPVCHLGADFRCCRQRG